jgi:hypothetical protein
MLTVKAKLMKKKNSLVMMFRMKMFVMMCEKSFLKNLKKKGDIQTRKRNDLKNIVVMNTMLTSRISLERRAK